MSNYTISYITGTFLYSSASTVESQFNVPGSKGVPLLTLNFNDTKSIILLLNFPHTRSSSNPLLPKESLSGGKGMCHWNNWLYMLIMLLKSQSWIKSLLYSKAMVRTELCHNWAPFAHYMYFS